MGPYWDNVILKISPLLPTSCVAKIVGVVAGGRRRVVLLCCCAIVLFVLAKRAVEWRRCTIQGGCMYGLLASRQICMDRVRVLIHSMPHMYPCDDNPENFSVRYARTCMRAAASFGGLIGGEPLAMSL